MSWGRGIDNNQAGDVRARSIPALREALKEQKQALAKALSATLIVREAEDLLPTDLAKGAPCHLHGRSRSRSHGHDHGHGPFS